MSRPTRSPHPTTTTTPSPIQHRRRKLLAFQIDITDLIFNTFMVNLSLGHYLVKLAAAKEAFYCLFGRPFLPTVKTRRHHIRTHYPAPPPILSESGNPFGGEPETDDSAFKNPGA
jgi:hypothetical protein